MSINLEAPPPNPVDVTVTSSSGSIVTVTQDGLVAGGTAVTFAGVTGTNVGTVFVQSTFQSVPLE